MHPWRTIIPVLLTLLLALSGCSDDDNPDGSGGTSGTGGSGGSSGTGGSGNTGGDEPGEPVSIQVISNGDVLAAVGAPEDFLANPIPGCTRMDNSSAGTTDVSFTCPDPGAGDYRVPVTAAGAVQVALRVEGEAQDSRTLGVGEGAFLEFTLPLEGGMPGCTASAECDVYEVCVDGSCEAGTLVFVSSTTYNGNLGGVLGADAKCAEVAAAAGLRPSTWLSWTADATFQPADAFAGQTIPYYLVDGTKVADDWADLSDISIDNPISLDERGNAAPDGALAWTNVDANGGVRAGESCSDFTSSDGAISGRVGDVFATGGAWGVAGNRSCDLELHLYCFAAGPL